MKAERFKAPKSEDDEIPNRYSPPPSSFSYKMFNYCFLDEFGALSAPAPSPTDLECGEKDSACENIQKREQPSGPSPINSWPSGLSQLAHNTFQHGAWVSVDSVSASFLSAPAVTGLVNAGQGEECSYLARLGNSGCEHCEHKYTPCSKWSLYFSLENQEQNDIFVLGIITGLPLLTLELKYRLTLLM